MDITVAAVLGAATGTQLDDSGYYLEKVDFNWDTAMLSQDNVTHVAVRGCTPVAVLMLRPDYATGFNRCGAGNHDLCPGEIIRLINSGIESLTQKG